MDAQSRVQPIFLPDGTRIRVRPIRPDDAPRLKALVARCSPQTIFLRANMVRSLELTDAEAALLTDLNYRTTMALAAVTGKAPCERIVAVARYACDGQSLTEAEAAILVEDAYQQCGLGRQLLTRLVDYARGQGIASLIGNVSPQNRAVLGMIRGTGLPAEYFDAGCGEYQVAVSLAWRAGKDGFPARALATAVRMLRFHLALPGQFAALFKSA